MLNRQGEGGRERPVSREYLENRGQPSDRIIAEHPEVAEDDIQVLREDGEIQASGKLPGKHDDFDGELDDRTKHVPGADKRHHPAHDGPKGDSKHLGV